VGTLKHIYNRTVRGIFTTLGIHEHVVFIYYEVPQKLVERIRIQRADPKVVTVEGTSATFSITTTRERGITDVEAAEREILADILETTMADDIVYDVGANIGLYSCLLGQHLGQGSLYAFEPLPANATRIRKNVRLNDLGDTVTVRQVALGSETKRTEFHISDDRPGNQTASLEPQPGTEPIDIELVNGEKLEQRGVPAPDIVKIDVEGAELDALEGLTSQFSAGRPRAIYCEVHRNRGVSPATVKAFFDDQRFDTEVLVENMRGGKQQYLKATKDAASPPTD